MVCLKEANMKGSQYVYLRDLIKLDMQPGCTTPVSWPTSPTPLHIGNWEKFLSSHPDQEFASRIHAGLTYGFCIGCNRQDTKLVSASRNHPSASANLSVVSDYIRTELEDGRLEGPLRDILRPLVHVSPIGLVPKSHQVDR